MTMPTGFTEEQMQLIQEAIASGIAEQVDSLAQARMEQATFNSSQNAVAKSLFDAVRMNAQWINDNKARSEKDVSGVIIQCILLLQVTNALFDIIDEESLNSIVQSLS